MRAVILVEVIHEFAQKVIEFCDILWQVCKEELEKTEKSLNPRRIPFLCRSFDSRKLEMPLQDAVG